MKTTPSDFRNYDDFDLETGVGVSNRVKDDSKNKKDNKSDSNNSALKIEIEKDEPMPSTSAPGGYHYEQTPCVGSYEVEGYTRDDGKEVDDYIRTCGAKHWRLVKDTKVDDGITGGAANIDNTETNSSSNTPINESHSNTDDESVLKGGIEKTEGVGDIDTESFSPCDNFIQLGKAFSSEFPNLLNSALSDATQLSKGVGDNETKNNLQKTVRALKKSQEFQEEVLTHVFKKIDSTKDKTHKEELQKEYSQLKNENIKTTALVDKVDNDLKNNDYNRVVQDIKEYNSKPNSEDANNQTVNKQSEINETKPVSNKGEVKNSLETPQSSKDSSNKIEYGNNIKNEKHDITFPWIMNFIQQSLYENFYQKPLTYVQKELSQHITSYDPYMEYYKIFGKLANGEIASVKDDKNNTYQYFSSFQKGNLKNFIQGIITNRCNLNPNQRDYNQKLSNMVIVTPKKDSPVLNNFVNSVQFHQFIQAHINDIKAGVYKNSPKAIVFESPFKLGINKDTNPEQYRIAKSNHLTFDNIELYNLYIDNRGNLNCDGVDLYDFATLPFGNTSNDKRTIIVNNNAYYQQKIKKGHPYIIQLHGSIPEFQWGKWSLKYR